MPEGKHDRGYFWVGVERVTSPNGTVARGPMYVEWETPARRRYPHPVVLIHGGGGQGLDYLGTPDGRPGWARILVEQGYEVYVVDRPGHGRSPHHPDVLGPMGPQFTFEASVELFAPPTEGQSVSTSSHPAAAGSHPTSHLHTQWPGGREIGDPVFDQLVASSGFTLASWADMHALEQTRMAELLDRIGPAVLVAHSAGGPAGFLAADARPDLVTALVAIESAGPPFLSVPGGISLDWGVTAAPLTFDPPAAQATDLQVVAHDPPGPGEPPMMLQAEPARKLPNLSRLPIAVVTAEASRFLQFDRHLMAFLKQAGCGVELVRLADHGVHGNGHGMMLEKNNRDSLQVILDWVNRSVPA